MKTRGRVGGRHVANKASVSSTRHKGKATTNARKNTPRTRRPARHQAHESDSECYLALVSATNDADPHATRLNVSVVDFPGLLRVVAWVLNGLELQVVRAKLSTDDNMAGQEFFITDLNGEPYLHRFL